MNTTDNFNGNIFLPLFGVLRTEGTDIVKEAHEAYDIYVNGDFVGKKVLLTQTENIDDTLDFLKKQGISDVTAHLKGDHYIIETKDENELNHLKDALSTYLHNR
ncbi:MULTISPECIES: hypothetical protein [Bacillaceae]|uniref:hypothetical protein n=1 Tax=Bacillaceae TaxID=186817 RepID=UPI000685FFA6|nr:MULTISPECIES: hypothetical protein [Bacillaceae]UOE92039.1 hypothetical protein MM271_12240 [Alkalihalobacillus sp. LMS39]